jgi:hypothetical protein
LREQIPLWGQSYQLTAVVVVLDQMASLNDRPFKIVFDFFSPWILLHLQYNIWRAIKTLSQR